MSDSLLTYVVDRLQESKGRWPSVAEGSGVPLSSIHRIASGEAPNPGILNVEALARYFRNGGDDSHAQAS